MKTSYYDSAELSDLGRKRKNNEDACIRIPDQGVFCVADGMGGVVGGDLASEAITTSIQDAFRKCAPGQPEGLAGRIKLFKGAVNSASRWIKNFADEKVIGQMGSTVVALIFEPSNPTRGMGIHAGDSRLHRFRKGELKVLTQDHSAVAALAAKLGRDPDTLPAKYQNELLRAVGLTESVELELTPVDVASGDLFLLCSDGLTRMVPNDGITKILKRADKEPLEAIAKALIDAANQAGGKDNITAVLVKMGDITSLPLLPEPVLDDEPTTNVAGETPESEDVPCPPTPSGQSTPPDSDDVIQGDTPHTDDESPPEPTPQDKTPQETTPPEAKTPQEAKTPEAKTPEAKTPETPSSTAAQVTVAAPVASADTKPTVAASRQSAEVKPVVAAPPGHAAQAPRIPQPLPAQPPEPRFNIPPIVRIGGAAVVVIVVLVALFVVPRQRATKSLKDLAEVTPTPPAVATSSVAPTEAAAARPPPLAPAVSNVQAKQVEVVIPRTGQWPSGAQVREADGDMVKELQDLARKALVNGQYSNAVTFASTALKSKPNDAESARIVSEAQAALAQAHAAQQAEQTYQAAVKAGQTLFDRQDFGGAQAKAEEALALKASGVEAARLKQKVQAKLDELKAVQERERQFQAALEAAKAALAQPDFAAAIAKVNEGLKLKPGDAAATQLKAQVLEARDLATAQDRFAQADYVQAQALCVQHADAAAFKELAGRIALEQQALKEAAGRFANGDYGFVDGLKSQSYAAKKPFAELLAKAAAEAQVLADLQGLRQTNNAQALTAKLADPAVSAFAGKPPFRALAQWAQSAAAPAPSGDALGRLDLEFEQMLVWFNIVKSSSAYLRTPEARKEKRFDGELGVEQRQRFLEAVSRLENGFKTGGWLSERERGKYLAELRTTITHHP